MSDNQSSSHSPGGKNSKRRDFLGILLGGGFLAWIVSLFYPVIKYLKPPELEETNVTSVKIGENEIYNDLMLIKPELKGVCELIYEKIRNGELCEPQKLKPFDGICFKEL